MKKERNKIGIITLYGNSNYGNRLQNFAVQVILKEFGFEPDTIVVQRTNAKGIAKAVYHKVKYLRNDAIVKKNKAFDKFNKKYISTKHVFSHNGIIPHSLSKTYRFFVVGSDQVWNPLIRKTERENFFLQFADDNQRICIAPSIGVDRIPNEYREEFATYFKGFGHLSCRESEGAAEISLLANKKCTHIVDPTLAIDAEKWRTFARPITDLNQDYVLVFFLGNMDSYEKERISAFARKNSCKVIELSDKNCPYYSIDPTQFVWLIEHAKMVFTDSFHAAAFSVNLNTPFYVYDRHKEGDTINTRSSSRIRSLVSSLELNERYIGDHLNEIDSDCDFKDANMRLEYERVRFKEYVRLCLE